MFLCKSKRKLAKNWDFNKLVTWKIILGSLYSIKGPTKIPISQTTIFCWEGHFDQMYLIQALPTCVMQSIMLPKFICNIIDKKCKNFIWKILINLEKFIWHHGAPYVHLKGIYCEDRLEASQ
ncbi:hypothetical protein CR513_04283, partial [Mucuna pruriens]